MPISDFCIDLKKPLLEILRDIRGKKKVNKKRAKNALEACLRWLVVRQGFGNARAWDAGLGVSLSPVCFGVFTNGLVPLCMVCIERERGIRRSKRKKDFVGLEKLGRCRILRPQLFHSGKRNPPLLEVGDCQKFDRAQDA